MKNSQNLCLLLASAEARSTHLQAEIGQERLRYLEKVETESWKHIIPGHGRPGGRELIAKEIKYLRFLRNAVEKGIAAGKSAEEILNELNVDEFKAYTWPGSLKTSILTIYNEMKTE